MNKLDFNNINWKEFKVGKIFEVKNSKPYHKCELEETKDKNNSLPYITRTSFNNGMDSIIRKKENFFINSGNCITLGAENSDFFYQEKDFITGNKMYLIKHDKLNKFNGLFLVQVFRNNIKGSGYGFGMGLTGTRLKGKKILLPVDENNSPNWQFMENYIKQEEIDKINKILNYYKNNRIDSKVEKMRLSNINWKDFDIKDIFVLIKRGKRLIKKNQNKGNIPYISSTSISNGVDNFIGNKDKVRRYKNCITIANSGSVGYSFYHPYEFIASDHVTGLVNEQFNKYIYLFLTNQVQKLEEKYSFNREISDKRINREKILLPIDENNNPDWEFMENYMKQIEFKKIKDIINYYEKRLEELELN